MPANILVVEDEAIIAEDIGTSLRNLGYSVAGIASTGEEAVAKARDLHPSLVLMDIMLQGEMDGVEAAERILRQCNVPVVYLTAHTDDNTFRRAKLTEPYSYVIKPYEEKELQIAIEMALYNHEVKTKLRRVENWFATALKSLGDAVIATDRDGAVTYMNPMAEGITGWSRRELFGRQLSEVVRLRDLATDQPREDPVRRSLRDGLFVDSSGQTGLLTRDGRVVPIHESAAPIRDEKQNVSGVVFVFRDVTQLRRKEGMLRDQLREAEIRYQNLVEQVPAIIYASRLSDLGNWTYVSPQIVQTLGYTPTEWLLQQENWLAHVHAGDREAVLAERNRAIADGRSVQAEYRMLARDGGVVWVRDEAVVMGGTGEDGPVLHGVLTNITDRKKAEEEAVRSHQELRALAARLQSVREEERSRISREIHDELGQVLTGLKIDISWLANHHPEPDSKYRDKTDSMLKLIDRTIDTVRKISLELRPSMIDDLGLAAAIEWETGEFQKRTGIRCRFHAETPEGQPESEITIALFRILQEALTNILRHARASRVDVTLRQTESEIELQVRDNGVGIQQGDVSSKRSLGVLGMCERAHVLGGEVRLSSARKGTVVTARIPLTRNAPRAQN
jgi:PAS domain S-box-containing protein